MEQWNFRRASWYAKIHAILDVEGVLQTQFEADERVREAEAALLRAQEAN